MNPKDASSPEMNPGQLRRLKLLADFSDDQLATFVSLVERVQVPIAALILRMHGEGDAMYLILDGEVEVSRTKDGHRTVLAKLETGEFFGEMCLVDESPRSADVSARRSCTLLKITKRTFDSMLVTHPDIVALFLRGMLRIVAGRVRSMNKRYEDERVRYLGML